MHSSDHEQRQMDIKSGEALDRIAASNTRQPPPPLAGCCKCEALAEQIGSLKASIRLIHEREWPAGDKTKAARHARVMWEIADAARQTENF